MFYSLITAAIPEGHQQQDIVMFYSLITAAIPGDSGRYSRDSGRSAVPPMTHTPVGLLFQLPTAPLFVTGEGNSTVGIVDVVDGIVVASDADSFNDATRRLCCRNRFLG